MHILEFLSASPLKGSFAEAPASVGDALRIPKCAMIKLSPQQQARMLDVSRALAADVLTDGHRHFMLMGAFACCLPVKH